MNFSEALRKKKYILRNTSEFTKTLHHYIIIPALEEEGKKYIDDLKRSSFTFRDEQCKTYSSNGQFIVFLCPKGQK